MVQLCGCQLHVPHGDAILCHVASHGQKCRVSSGRCHTEAWLGLGSGPVFLFLVQLLTLLSSETASFLVRIPRVIKCPWSTVLCFIPVLPQFPCW